MICWVLLVCVCVNHLLLIKKTDREYQHSSDWRCLPFLLCCPTSCLVRNMSPYPMSDFLSPPKTKLSILIMMLTLPEPVQICNQIAWQHCQKSLCFVGAIKDPKESWHVTSGQLGYKTSNKLNTLDLQGTAGLCKNRITSERETSPRDHDPSHLHLLS